MRISDWSSDVCSSDLCGIAQHADYLLGCILGAVDKETVHAVFDLFLDTADIAANDDRAFPHGFGHCQAEAFAEGLLEHHGGPALERVDQRGVLYRDRKSTRLNSSH